MPTNLSTAFNIYCDESRVENVDSKKMVIGAVLLPRLKKTEITNLIKRLKHQHNFFQEIKWNKVGQKYFAFYKEIIDLFFSEDDLDFRCIVVDKTKVEYGTFHDNDQELAFFKFYYLMLRKRLNDYNQYFIFLDKKPTRDKNRARSLRSFLESYILLYKKNCNIRHLQSYSSTEMELIQLSDFFTGLMAFSCNQTGNDRVKTTLVNYLKEKIGRKVLCSTTPLSENKFNVFVWKGDDS
jgi:hypothetical protein